MNFGISFSLIGFNSLKENAIIKSNTAAISNLKVTSVKGVRRGYACLYQMKVRLQHITAMTILAYALK
jgi:hypothetical protein